MSEHVLAILVKAVGSAKAAKDLKGIDQTISGIGARAGKGLRDTGRNLEHLGVIAGGIAAAGLVAAVKSAADFQSQLNTINTVAQLTAPELQKVGEGIRGLARDTGASLEDLTGAYYDLVSAGIKPGADALKVLTLANTLAIGGLATTGETVDLLTTAINTYRLNAKGAAKATDQFAEAIALGKVTAAQIAETFSIVGPLAQAMGIGIDQISASYAQLTAKGIPAAEAMTDMRSALAGLAKPTATLTKAQKVLGINFAKLAREKGLQAALIKIRAYSEKTGIPLAKLLGRIEAVQYTLSTTGNNASDYAKALDQVRKATGTAAEQMGERQKGLNYQLLRLKALATDAGITIGAKLLPKLTPLAEKAVAFLNTHQADIDKFGDSIAEAFDKAGQFAEKIPWAAIGSGLKTAADWAGKLMDVFLAMPPEVQTTIIALAGLNKLSGGAIGGIVGELGKGLIKGVLGMNAGVVNINAGVVNGVGGGVSGAAGAAESGLAGAIKTTAKWIVPLAVTAAAVEILQNSRNEGQRAANETNTTVGRYGNLPTMSTKEIVAALSIEDRDLRDIKNFTAGTENNVGKVSDDIAGTIVAVGAVGNKLVGIHEAVNRQGVATNGLPGALSRLHDATNGVKGKLADDVAATHGVRAAINAKKLAVTVKTTSFLKNTITVNNRDIVHQASVFSGAGGHVIVN